MVWFLTINATNVTNEEEYMKFEKFEGFTSNQHVDMAEQINACS
jgi:hypothetical protein